MEYDADIFVSGGGVAGLAAAAAFGAAGFRVVAADPAPQVTEATAEGADLRTTAVLQPGRDLLAEAGVWDRLAPHAIPLATMRIVDASGPGGAARTSRDFDSADLGDAPFGWNLPNWLLRRELLGRLAELGSVDFRSGTGFASLLSRAKEARVTLTDGSRLRVRLVVAADGRDSPVRQAAGIGARTIRYGQKAVVCAMGHGGPHDNISTEIHRAGGPFTLVPLPDHEGRPCSALVWMMPGPEAQRLLDLPQEAFEAAATDRSAGLYGPLRLVTRRSAWPIITRIADRMAGERVALMAEAAHVMPPIGAQGLNTSLKDLAVLLDLATAAPHRLGEPEMLDAYTDRRQMDVQARVAGIDALNRASMAGMPMVQDLRARGMAVLHDIAPVRRAMMRLGLGASGA